MHTKPGDNFRILGTWNAQCFGDSYSVDACGPSWSEISDSYHISDTNATVKFFKGASQFGSTITVPPKPTGANPERKYWWWIADVEYDANNDPIVHTVNTLHECLPLPYAIDGGTVTGGLREKGYLIGMQDGVSFSNWCTPIPFVTGT